jgi:RNase P subunit RPR2
MATMVESAGKKLHAGDPRESKPFGETIRCSRCNGLMVGEQGFAARIDTGEASVSLRRCVQCGEIVDPVILRNRRLQHGTDLSRT